MLRQLIASFIIVAICVVIHIGGIVLLAEWLLDRHLERNKRSGMMSFMPVLITIFAIFIVLHMTETAIWAVFYLEWGLFPDFETSLYYSLTSFTTIGFGDVVLPEKWRLLGGIEGISGVLLSGLSTAYLFVILNSLFQIRSKQPDEDQN
jgi:voltage-gated potassium channel